MSLNKEQSFSRYVNRCVLRKMIGPFFHFFNCMHVNMGNNFSSPRSNTFVSLVHLVKPFNIVNCRVFQTNVQLGQQRDRGRMYKYKYESFRSFVVDFFSYPSKSSMTHKTS